MKRSLSGTYGDEMTYALGYSASTANLRGSWNASLIRLCSSKKVEIKVRGCTEGRIIQFLLIAHFRCYATPKATSNIGPPTLQKVPLRIQEKCLSTTASKGPWRRTTTKPNADQYYWILQSSEIWTNTQRRGRGDELLDPMLHDFQERKYM